MNKHENKSTWKITNVIHKQRWDDLTNDDLQYATVRRDGMLGRIQNRTGGSREAIERTVREASPSS